jgi:hypothetical protein
MFKKIKDWVLGTKPVEQSTNWPHPEKSEPVVPTPEPVVEVPKAPEPVVAKAEEPKSVPASPVKKPAPVAKNHIKKKPAK